MAYDYGTHTNNQTPSWNDSAEMAPQENSLPPYTTTADTNYREFGFYLTKSNNVVVTGFDDTAIFFCDNSQSLFRSNDIALHSVDLPDHRQQGRGLSSSDGRTGRIIGTAHFHNNMNTIDFSPGDASNGGNQGGATMTTASSWSRSQYDFEFIDANSGMLNGFSWQRTHATEDGAEGGSFRRHLDSGTFKLVNLATGEILALFLNNTSMGFKRGKLRIYNIYPTEQLEIPILLTCLSIVEISRRIKRRSNAAAH